MRILDRQTEAGAALVFALVFISLFGLLTSLMLADVDAGLRTTRIAETKHDGMYGADAGLERGIQMLRLHSTLCAFPGDDGELLSQFSWNTRTVEVRCDVDWGSAVGAEGWAIITRDPSTQGLTTQSGVSTPKIVQGPVFAGGIANDINMEVREGDVYEKAGGLTCSSNANKPDALTITPSPPYRYRCTGLPIPDPAHVLPTSVPPAAPPWTDVGNCRQFWPGKYTGSLYPNGKLPILARNYFTTGVYYFEDVNIDLRSTEAVGGAAHSAEENVNGVAPCAADPPDWNKGTGVKWLLGGNSLLFVDNPSAKLELYTRLPVGALTASGSDGSEGTDGISLQAIQSGAPAGWVASTHNINSAALLAVEEGTTPALAIHGMAYLPNARVDFRATNTSKAQLRGGIVAGRLNLQASASASGFVISINTGPRVRRIILTAKVSGTPPTIARAVIQMANDANRTVTIHSWRTSCSSWGTKSPTSTTSSTIPACIPAAA